jgi:isocitrate lyase
MNKKEQIAELENEWQTNPRWQGIKRDYSAKDVVNLRGSMIIEATIAKKGAKKNCGI